jgi:Na+-transporting NADH:ubiquinone oxidoreductase subunit C
MSSNNDTISKTLIVVISLCLVCAFIVSTAAVQLRPAQQANQLLDAQTNILRSAKILDGAASPAKVRELFAKHVEERIVDLTTGEFTDKDPMQFDYRRSWRDPELSTQLSKKEDVASIRRKPHYAPVYLVTNAENELISLVLPIHGYGLWSTMHAFIALETDGNTIIAMNYYEQGETPGLGGEIENPRWIGQFEEKKLFDEQGNIALNIVRPGNASDPNHDIDGLSGATLTANGVQNTFTFWMGEQGFGPFLSKVHQGALNNG